MFVVDRATGKGALAIGTAKPVRLRFRSDGQLLELPLGKVTIGSSPRCVLRIQKPGVEPVHCLLVHEAERLTVRRWAADTQLNGSPFDDAILRAGDCLSLGSVELELVADEPALELPSEPETQPEVLPASDESDETTAQLEEVSDLLDALQTEAELPPPPPVDPEVEPASDPRHEAEPPLTFAEVAAATPIETVELLFRELQAANGIARSRSRKMLAALRRERAGNEKLVKRLGEATVQLTDLHRERTDWEKSQWEAMQERRQWEEKVEALDRQARESDDRFAEQSRLIADLERFVEEARTNAVPVEPAPFADASPALSETPVVEPEFHGSDADVTHDDNPHEQANEQGTDFEPKSIEWSSNADHQPAAWDEAPADVTGDESRSVESQSTNELSTVESEPWSQPAEQESAWAEPAVQPQESVAQIWQDLASQTKSESPSANSNEMEPVRATETPTSDEDDISPFAAFSIWKQGAVEEPASAAEPESFGKPLPESVSPIWGERSFGDAEETTAASDVPAVSENPWATPSASSSEEVVEAPKPKIEPPSFIDRYAHMFADETAGATSKPIEPVKPLFADSPSSNLLGTGSLRPEPKAFPAASTDDEESIEQYMAKLMQRVRGDAPAGAQLAASQAPPMPQSAPEIKNPATDLVAEQAVPTDATSGDDVNSEEEDAREVAVNWEAIARRAAAAPKTNLGALRALANESARRAISRHELKKHRRNAVTKVIVSTLAGMTSLWLMLDAPDWRDLQFITACGALLVAAFWAGEAFRAMKETRAAVYDGPSGEAELIASLPIDVPVEA